MRQDKSAFPSDRAARGGEPPNRLFQRLVSETVSASTSRVVLDEGLAAPILIGRPEVIEMRIKKIGLNLKPGRDFEIVNPESDPRYRELWSDYYALMKRDGVTPDLAKAKIRRDTTLIGAMMLRRGDGDASPGLVRRVPRPDARRSMLGKPDPRWTGNGGSTPNPPWARGSENCGSAAPHATCESNGSMPR